MQCLRERASKKDQEYEQIRKKNLENFRSSIVKQP